MVMTSTFGFVIALAFGLFAWYLSVFSDWLLGPHRKQHKQ
jgi:hypothetical protein